ncbi:MAG: FkbM family methyltransferase [Chloroflexi bacterium]|nr:FkbM family methyltransferase [Chloroflexota bacterium]
MNDSREMLLKLFTQASFPYHPAHSVRDLLGNKKIFAYGGGDGFITFSVFVLRKYGLEAYAVLDRKFKCGDTHLGVPAFSPLEYTPTAEEKADAVVVVTVGKKEYHKEIFNCLRGLGFKNVILATEIYEYHLLHTPKELEAQGWDYYLNNQNRIMACFDLWTDDLSREIFFRVIQTHMHKMPIRIPDCALEDQYFPKDINLKKGYSRFVNCGAYNGDTVMRLNTLSGKVDAVACFEPDPYNFELLTRYLCAHHHEMAHEVVAFPCGVFSHEMQLHFAGGDKINSMISETGESIIQCVSLDRAIPGFKPTFISMDVEGVELEALQGAEMLVKENKPDLGICVYHAPNHIWDIPLYLADLHLGYRFFLRNYTSFISETVLYATT